MAEGTKNNNVPSCEFRREAGSEICINLINIFPLQAGIFFSKIVSAMRLLEPYRFILLEFSCMHKFYVFNKFEFQFMDVNYSFLIIRLISLIDLLLRLIFNVDSPEGRARGRAISRMKNGNLFSLF